MAVDEPVRVRHPAWTVLVWVLALSPHAVPMSWIIHSAVTMDGGRAVVQLVACYEVMIAAVAAVVAAVFTGRLMWVRRIGLAAAVIGAVVVIPSAFIVGAS